MQEYRSQPLYALPVLWPFPCRTNSDYGEELLFQDGTEPMDLTGMTFQADVKRSPESDEVLHSFGMAGTSTGEGFYLVDAEGGALQVRFMWETIKSMFDDVFPGNMRGQEMELHYDLLVTEADGFRSAWLHGPITIDRGITNG